MREDTGCSHFFLKKKEKMMGSIPQYDWSCLTDTEFNDLRDFLIEMFPDLDSDPIINPNCSTKQLSNEWTSMISRIRTVRNKRKREYTSPDRVSKRQRTTAPDVDFYYEYLRLYYPWSTNDGHNQAALLNSKESEDVCFGCKDGGRLIQCDVRGCKKVYHKSCTLNNPPPAKGKWMCPRHFCNGCNKTDNIAFMCAFCTIASCKDCPSIIQNHFGWNDYVVLPNHMLHPNDCLEKYANITWIACHLCTKHLKERKKKHPMELDPLDMSNVQQFCGACNE